MKDFFISDEEREVVLLALKNENAFLHDAAERCLDKTKRQIMLNKSKMIRDLWIKIKDAEKWIVQHP